MTRTIVVSSNCQTGGLAASLAAMLPGDHVIPVPWLAGEPEALRDVLAGAQVWVTSQPRAQAEAMVAEAGSGAQVLVVPLVWFRAFHPDVVHPSVGGAPLPGGFGPYHSSIALWGWLHGARPEAVAAAYRADVFDALGYFDFALGVSRLRSSFQGTDVDFASWYLPLTRNGVFMLTDNHPRIDALIGLGREIAAQLGAAPDALRHDWRQHLVDGLQTTSFVWPLEPEVGKRLDLNGLARWRTEDGELLDRTTFLERSFAAYAAADPSTVHVERFVVDGRFDRVLPEVLGTLGAVSA